jgi:hypothetical protein
MSRRRIVTFCMSPADVSSLSFWSALSLVGFCCVLVGVIMEGAEIVARRRSKPSSGADNGSGLAHVIGDFGWLILVIGLALELWGHIKIEEITGRENRRLNEALSKATTLSGSANERAAQSDERSKKLENANLESQKQIEIIRADNARLLSIGKEAERAAAEASAALETVKKERASVELQVEAFRQTNLVLQSKVLELEAKTSPRGFTAQQREIILNHLASVPIVPLEKCKVRILYETPDTEAWLFASRVTGLLREAGFVANFEDANFARRPGQPIFFGWRFVAQDTPISRGIVAAFKEGGHDFDFGRFDGKNAVFTITLGAKP